MTLRFAARALYWSNSLAIKLYCILQSVHRNGQREDVKERMGRALKILAFASQYISNGNVGYFVAGLPLPAQATT